MHISSSLQSLISALPDLYIILKPDHPTYTVVAVSDAYLKSTMKQGETLIGRGLFEVFTPYNDEHVRANALVRASFQQVIKSGKPDIIQQHKYNLKDRNGVDTPRYWRLVTTPVFQNGRLAYIAHAIDDVSSQFLTEERLEDTQRRLNDTLAAGSIATWVWNIPQDKVYGDKNYALFFGVSHEQAAAGMSPQSFTMAIHPDDRKSIKTLVAKALQAKLAFEAEYRIIGPKGAVRWVIARGQVEKDKKGQPIRFPGVLVDITARKSAEEAVRQSEAQLKFMAEAMPQKVFTANAQGLIDYYNPQWTEFTGLDYKALKGRGWEQCIHPDDLAQVHACWQEALRTGNPLEMETRYRAADGGYRWHITRARAMRDEKGVITKWVGSSTDIGDSKQNAINLDFLARASQVLASSLDYDDTLARVAELAVPDIADWCTIHLYDPKVGLTQVAMAHKDPKKIQWAQDVRKKHPTRFDPERGIGKVIVTGRPEFYSFIPPEMLTREVKDSAYRDILNQMGISAVIIAPLKIHDKPVGAISFISAEQKRRFTEDDLEMAQELAHRAALAMTNAQLYRSAQEELHERTRLEAQLRDANEDLEARVKERTLALEATNQSLERSNRELQDFAYVASHDLQEPLRKIQAFGNLLEEEYGTILGEGRDYLMRMRKAASRMSGLIEDLLAFSRVTTTAQPFTTINLSEIVEEVLGDLETRIAETNGVVKIKKLYNIVGDPVQIRQLMQNLIANALKFHRPGVPPVVTISCTTTKANDGEIEAYNISITDNGIGFDEKYLDRIFAVFQRLHNRDSYEGTGIGLAVCRKIIERHNGTITATSKLNEGATFTVTLPAHPVRTKHE